MVMILLKHILLFQIIEYCSGNSMSYSLLRISKEVVGKQLVENYCISTNSTFEHRTKNWQTKVNGIADMTAHDFDFLCSENEKILLGKNKLIFALRGRCPFFYKVQNALKVNAQGLIIVNPQNYLFSPLLINESNSEETQQYYYIPDELIVAVLKETDFLEIRRRFLTKDSHVSATIYKVDVACRIRQFAILFGVALVTVVVGSVWSGFAAHKEGKKEMSKRAYKCIIILTILVFIIILFTRIIYTIISFLMIGCFPVVSTTAIFLLLRSLVRSSRLVEKKFVVDLCRKKKVSVTYIDVALVLPSAALPVVWIVLRNYWFGWILQDIQCFLICIAVMKNIKLSCLFIIFLLTCVFLLYDLCFVFLNPFFSQKLSDMMTQYAKYLNDYKLNRISKRSAEFASVQPPSTIEKLPFIFIIPRLCDNLSWKCPLQFDVIGLGDIIFPGLITSYVYKFDLSVKSHGLYLGTALIAYSVGLIAAFAVEFLTEMNQSVLLFTLTSMFVSMLMVSLCRKETLSLWSGD